ncbi:hypothetical protein ACQRIU_001986 [Beauveria bassiana]
MDAPPIFVSGIPLCQHNYQQNTTPIEAECLDSGRQSNHAFHFDPACALIRRQSADKQDESNSFDRDRNFESAISFNRFTPDHIQQTRQALVMNYSGLIAHIRSQAHSISHVLQSLDAPGAHTAREPAVAHTPRSSAVQQNDQTRLNQRPVVSASVRFLGSDLPVEITTNVKSGDNELHVSLPSLSQNEVEYDYFVGVEIVTTQNTWKVSICDPISSKMCDTPVRGIDCKHFECFDLENWLQTRPLKPGALQTEPCLVDCWACPICGDDARPNQLRICDYFSDVVKQLREAGNSEMRTIVISENAEWQPLVEISYYQKQESPSGGHLHQSQQAAKKVEVIEILDD